MRALLKVFAFCVAVVVVVQVLPPGMRPAWLNQLRAAKPLETVSLDQALTRSLGTRGKFTISVLYLTGLPSMMADELANDARKWQKAGVVVHAFSIDAVPNRGEVAKYVRNIGFDVPPVWIKMPEGERCAFEQLRAVNSFTGGPELDPSRTIPLLTLVLRDRGGRVLQTHSINVPNGGLVDMQEFEHALAPFDVQVSRALR